MGEEIHKVLKEEGLLPKPEPCPQECFEKIDAEIIRVLTEEGLLPKPKPADNVFFLPDYENSEAVPVPLPSVPTDGPIGEFTYTAPDNGYISLSGTLINSTESSLKIEVTTEGIVIAGETLESIAVASTVMIGRIPIEKGRTVVVIFSGSGSGGVLITDAFLTFYPLKKVVI